MLLKTFLRGVMNPVRVGSIINSRRGPVASTIIPQHSKQDSTELASGDGRLNEHQPANGAFMQRLYEKPEKVDQESAQLTFMHRPHQIHELDQEAQLGHMTQLMGPDGPVPPSPHSERRQKSSERRSSLRATDRDSDSRSHLHGHVLSNKQAQALARTVRPSSRTSVFWQTHTDGNSTYALNTHTTIPFRQIRQIHHKKSTPDPAPTVEYLSTMELGAEGRDKAVDIHDVASIDPKEYDVLLPDITHGTMMSELSERANVNYLQPAPPRSKGADPPTLVRGFLYGRKNRQILPCVVTIGKTSLWVLFVVNSGAPLTYISRHVVRAFGCREDEGPWTCYVDGIRQKVEQSPCDSQFREVNILGSDFLEANDVITEIDGGAKKVNYYLGGGWKVTKDSS